jgi:subtilisin family serine protease
MQRIDILGSRDFVATGRHQLFDELDHGTSVLSCIAMKEPYLMVGTAPDASFWLLRSEDSYSESLVEEDYWAAAVEFADSVGADIISSSLGYYEFDDKSTSHQYKELNGRTALISCSSSLLAGKGIVHVNSAGNAGRGTWKKIGFPADAIDMLTVGAADSSKKNTVFSSLGPAADGRVKPDVMAMGLNTAVVKGNGRLGKANGTSFSCPVTAGMVACLWQALPQKTAKEIIEIVRQNGDNYTTPDNVFGYGFPNYWQAYIKNK